MKETADMKTVRMWATLGTVLMLQAQVACSPTSNVSSYDPVKVEAQIRENSQAWADIAVTGDPSVMETIFADDFVGTDYHGELYTKRDFIDRIRANPPGCVSNNVNDVKVRFFGNVAVAQGHETLTCKDGISNRFVWTDIYVLRGDRWELVAAQDMMAPEMIDPTADGSFNSSRSTEKSL